MIQAADIEQMSLKERLQAMQLTTMQDGWHYVPQPGTRWSPRPSDASRQHPSIHRVRVNDCLDLLLLFLR